MVMPGAAQQHQVVAYAADGEYRVFITHEIHAFDELG
jgi:hypothetical protein